MSTGFLDWREYKLLQPRLMNVTEALNTLLTFEPVTPFVGIQAKEKKCELQIFMFPWFTTALLN